MAIIKDRIYDYAIIGGCPTGLTLACLLLNAGKSVVVLESAKIGIETTGCYHAQIETFEHHLSLANEPRGQINTYDCGEVNSQAIEFITRIISAYKIDCGFTKITNRDLHSADNTRKEDHPQWVPSQNKVQSILNSFKYLAGISRACIEKDGTILDNRRILKLGREEEVHFLHTSKGMVKSREIIYTPRSSRILMLFPKSFIPIKSYTILAQLDNDNYRGYEAGKFDNGSNYIITHDRINPILELSGADYRVIKGKSNDKQFAMLMKFIEDKFGSNHFILRWSVAYYKPVDGIPCVGKITDGQYLAAGYYFSNLTLSTFAAIVLAQKILGRESTFNIVDKPNINTTVTFNVEKDEGKLQQADNQYQGRGKSGSK